MKPFPFPLAVLGLSALITATPLSAMHAAEPLIVVEDHGGVSALPYYEALNLQPRTGAVQRPPIPIPQIPPSMDAEAQMLPVRSEERRVGKACVRTCSSRWSPYI